MVFGQPTEPYVGKHRHVIGRHRRKDAYAGRHHLPPAGVFLLKAAVACIAFGAIMLMIPTAMDWGENLAVRSSLADGTALAESATPEKGPYAGKALAGMEPEPVLEEPTASYDSAAASRSPHTAAASAAPAATPVTHPAVTQALLTQPPTPQPADDPKSSPPPKTTLVIPAIALKELLYYAPPDEPSQLASLRKGPTHYGGTPFPGSPGNMVIGGHNGSATSLLNTSFRRLSNLKTGQEILLVTADHSYRYLALQKMVVDEGQVTELLRYGSGATVTLYTCTPRTNPFVRPTTRLVVRASLDSIDGRDVGVAARR